MIQNLRRLLILLLIVALPWPGVAMVQPGSVATHSQPAAELSPCHNLGDDSAAGLESTAHPLPHPESCAATHHGKCCVGCQVHSLPTVLSHFSPPSGVTPYPPPAERWSGFIPDLLHRPPR